MKNYSLCLLLSVMCSSCHPHKSSERAAASSLKNQHTFFYSNAAKEAVADAGIKETSSNYDRSLKCITVLGPLGVDGAIDALMRAQKEGILTAGEVSYIIHSSIGTALAHYFDVSPVKFRAKADAAGIKNLVQEAGDGVKKAFKATAEKMNEFGKWIKNKFKK